MRGMVLAVLITVAAAPGLAQDPSAGADPVAAEIVAEIARAESLVAAGQVDDALTVIFAANTLGLDEDAMDPLVRFLPNLAAARVYRLRFDWPETERYAAATLRALDTAEYAVHPLRLEAAARLGQALNRQGRLSEAAAILRPVVQAVDAAGGVTTPEAALVEFWLAATVTRLGEADWPELSRRVLSGQLHKGVVTGPEFLAFVYDYAELVHGRDGSTESLLRITQLMALMARDPDVVDLDRAVYLELHAMVLSDLGRKEEAAALMEEELAALSAARLGSMRYLAVGVRLAIVWFELGRIDEGIALLERLQAEALPDADPRRIGYIVTLKGMALDFMERDAEAQAAFREGYGIIRQVEPAHAQMALEAASMIRRDDPGFAAFAFAAELSDPSGIAPDGPAEAVLERFLSGLYAQNEVALIAPDERPEGADAVAWLRNRALHLALSGRGGPMQAELDALRSAGLAHDADQILLIEAIGRFWLGGKRPQDAPDLFAALDGLEARLPADQASLARALRVTALNFDGRAPEASEQLRHWIAARDMTRSPRTVWDVTAGMIATELAWLFLPREAAQQVMDDSLSEIAPLPGAVLARDYLNLVRLLNAMGDMESDRGLAELASLVQRVSAQVPEGHILRASSRFGLANALTAQDRHAEAQAMLAEAVEEYRRNPGHRADVLAFMQSIQAQSLAEMGQGNMSLNLARAAFAGLPPDARADYKMTIVVNLAWQLVDQGRRDEAADLAETALTDPNMLARLVPVARLDVLRNRAGLHREAGNLAQSEALLAEGEALLAQHPDIPPIYRAALQWEQGSTHWTSQRFALAFEAIVASNDTYAELRREIAARSASGRAMLRSEDAMRARTEAMMGWELVKTLRAGATP